MRILITGASGFVAPYLTERLAATGADIVLSSRGARGSSASRHPFMSADLTRSDDAKRLVREARPDVIVHAAGLVRGSASDLFQCNTVATIELVEAVQQEAPAARLIALGSAAEYGLPSSTDLIPETEVCKPVSIYGQAKLTASNYVLTAAERSGLDAVVLRVFNIIAPRNSPEQVIGSFVERAAASYDVSSPRQVKLGRLDAIRDFVSMLDIADAVAKLAFEAAAFRLINACSGEGRRVRDLIAYLNHLSGDRFEIVETGQAPAVGTVDKVVGDPTRFDALLGVPRRSIDRELANAWRLRVEGLAR